MNLDFELVDFYPEYSSKHATQGTLHIYIKSIGLDIRGIKYIRKNSSSYVFFPDKRGWDCDDKKFIRYSVISFTDKETYSGLITEIRLLMDDYFKTWVKPENLPTTKKEAYALWVKNNDVK